jgi:hypothetical protein
MQTVRLFGIPRLGWPKQLLPRARSKPGKEATLLSAAGDHAPAGPPPGRAAVLAKVEPIRLPYEASGRRACSM